MNSSIVSVAILYSPFVCSEVLCSSLFVPLLYNTFFQVGRIGGTGYGERAKKNEAKAS